MIEAKNCFQSCGSVRIEAFVSVQCVKLLLADSLLDLYLYKVDDFCPPSSCLHAHLPPGLLVIIVADAPGISQQWAGER